MTVAAGAGTPRRDGAERCWPLRERWAARSAARPREPGGWEGYGAASEGEDGQRGAEGRPHPGPDR